MVFLLIPNSSIDKLWHDEESSLRKLIGGGPQGALWGILEYLSQSNHNTDYVSTDRKFKFIDDLSIL